MPRRRAPRRKLAARRRPGLRRKWGVRSKRLRQPVQYFKRTQYLSGSLQALNTADVFGSYVFGLTSVPGYTEFTALYDQYKITGVKWSLIPRGSSSDLGTGTTTGQTVSVFSCLDYDDNTAPTSIDQICQYGNMKMTRTNKIHSRYLKPRPLANVYGSGGVTQTAPAIRNQWLDCNAANIPHYGIKYCLQQVPNGSQLFDLKIDYYLAFKNVR